MSPRASNAATADAELSLSSLLSVNGSGTSTAAAPRIDVFGRFLVSIGGSEIAAETWRRTHARRLLQLLCSQRRHGLLRGEVLRALWPALDEAHARNRLHHTLHLIRKGLEAGGHHEALVVIDGDTVRLEPGTRCDVAEFVELLARDGTDSERRQCLLAAIDLYRGDLAPDWLGDHDFEARRTGLRRLYLDALREAASLSQESGDFDQAIVLLQRRMQADSASPHSHIDYARALLGAGRCDAAVAHCQRAVQVVSEATDAECARPLEAFLHVLQRQGNKSSSFDPDRALPPPVLAPETCPKVFASRQQLFGREADIKAVEDALDDPHCVLVTVCGPPGSGRTSVALQVASRLQNSRREGAVLVPCMNAASEDALIEALRSALQPYLGDIPPSAEELLRRVRPREMLLVLDDVAPVPAVARVLERLIGVARDCRVLATSPRRLQMVGERAVPLGFLPVSKDTHADGIHTHPPAVDVLLEQVRRHSPKQRVDERFLANLSDIAAHVDGWPLALVVAGRWLSWMEPSEVIARFKEEQGSAETRDEQVESALARWLTAAGAALPLLSQVATFESWFTREDIAVMAAPTRSALDDFFARTTDTGMLQRRTRASLAGEVSEYRMPLLLRHRLRTNQAREEREVLQRQHACWLRNRAEEANSVQFGGARTAMIRALIGTYRDDIDVALRFMARSGDHAALLALLNPLLSSLYKAEHAELSCEWVSLALAPNANVSEPEQAALYLTRARIHSRLGNAVSAFQDAEAAYRVASGRTGSAVQLEAVELLQSLGRLAGSVSVHAVGTSRAHPLLSRGIEAGENLLRVSGVAARYGEFAKAAEMSARAVDVFRYFSCPVGEVRALRYQGRMSFALGDLRQVRTAANAAKQLADERDLRTEGARAQLMLAEAALARREFSEALISAGRVLSNVSESLLAIEVRAFKVLAWGYYFDGQTALADLMQGELAKRAEALGEPGHIANGHLLRALLASEQRERSRALNSIEVFRSALNASSGPFDVQCVYAEIACLSARMHRPAVAHGMLNALSTFINRPGHALRPLTQWRAHGAASLLPPQQREERAVMCTPRQALAELLT